MNGLILVTSSASASMSGINETEGADDTPANRQVTFDIGSDFNLSDLDEK